MESMYLISPLFYKIFRVLSIISLFINSFLPLSYVPSAFAQDESAPQEEVAQPTPSDQISSPAPTIELTPSPEPDIASPTPEAVPTPTLFATSTPTPTPESSPTPIDIGVLTPPVEPSPIPDPLPSPTPQPTPGELISENIDPLSSPTPEPTNSEIATPSPDSRICHTESQVYDYPTQEWTLADGVYRTNKNVELGVRYVFPGNDKVTLIFKCLPSDINLRTPLKIQQIKISDLNLPGTINPVTEFAYDITTGMADGTFEYDLTLPKPSDISTQLSYIEKPASEVISSPVSVEDIKQITDVKLEQLTDMVKANDINHFTIYIVTANVRLSGAVNGSGQVTISPGQSITVTMEVQLSGNEPNDWLSSRYQIEDEDRICVDTPNHNTTGTFTESFDITAPSVVGTYDLTLRAYDQSACPSGGERAETVLRNAITVATAPSVANPPLPVEACGLDIALVMDVSGSINSTELTQMKNAFKAFVDALSGTPTQFSVTKFDTTAVVLLPFTSVATGSVAIKNAIDSASGGGYTNWEDGLTKAWSTYDPRNDKPNLMIFSSDGNPNRKGALGTNVSEAEAVAAAVSVANTIKNARTRILALGIGSDLDTANMIAISGNSVDTGILTSDVITSDFANLASDLGELASTTCGGRISINKFVDGVQQSNGQTWSFTIDNGTTLTTDANGQTVSATLSVGQHSVSEVAIPAGYVFDHASCTNGTPDLTINGVKDISVTNNSIISCNFYNTTQKGTIIIVKDAVPNDGQDFHFSTTGTGLNPFSLDDDSDPTLTNTVIFNNLSPGAYSVNETPSLGWNGQSVCVSSIGDTETSAGLELDANESITCTFTNTLNQASLTLTKTVTNDNGGQASTVDFIPYINATAVVWGQSQTLTPGSYQVSESTLPGYIASSWGGDCASDGSVTLAPGDNKTCTITNDDIAPRLTLVKDVTNNLYSGLYPASSWTLTASDSSGTIISGTGPTVGPYPLMSGIVYTLSESGPQGYSASDWTCTGGTLTGNQLTLSPGNDVTCTITNTALPGKLIVKKVVNNDNGGTATVSDFSYQINQGASIPFELDGENEHLLSPGSYTVTEVTPTGYSVSYDNCSFDLSNDQTQICTITNEDQPPKLSLTKFVQNNNGGTALPSDWTLTAAGPSAISGQGYVQSGADFVAGSYTLSESGPEGYLASGWSCTGGLLVGNQITLINGQVVNCTITNDDKPATLIVKKAVNNDNGGTALCSDFSFSYRPRFIEKFESDCQNEYHLLPGDYTVVEMPFTGYGVSYDNCSDINLKIGQTAICTITNDDIAPVLTLTKQVLGGSASPADFGLSVNAQSVVSGQPITVSANSPIVINETGLAGYTFNSISGDPLCPSVLGGSITLSPGQNAACTITNSRTTGSITVKKIIDTDGDLSTTSDQYAASGWLFDVDGTSPDTTDAVAQTTDETGNAYFANLKTGTYTVVESTQPGYDLLSASCVSENGNFDGVDSIDGISVETSTNTVCLFYNSPAGSIHGYKFSDTNQDGIPQSDETRLPDWTINLYQQNSDGQSFDPLSSFATSSDQAHLGWYWFDHLFPGTYKICEVNQSGWVQTYPLNPQDNCHIVTLPDANNAQNQVSLNSVYGPEYNFGNIQKGSLTVYKFNDLNANGARDEGEPLLSDWEIYTSSGDTQKTTQLTDSNGQTVFSLTPGQYTLGETIQSGWYQSNIYCQAAGEGVKITQTGFAYGHHGACSGWNQCGDAQTCALKACQANGYDTLVSYGDQKPCTQFNNCSLFYNISQNLNYQADWGNWCGVMGVTDIVCANSSSPTPTPTQGDDLVNQLFGIKKVFAQNSDINNGLPVDVAPGQSQTCYIGNYQMAKVTVAKDVLTHLGQPLDDNTSFNLSVTGLALSTFSEQSPAVFDLKPGSYTFSEIDISSKYQLKSENDIVLNLQSGDVKSLTFTNWKVKPRLVISKYNDQWPNIKTPGSQVRYTIKLTVLDGDINDVEVTDLPPSGFKYRPGSYSVEVNGLGVGITEPKYSSPGKWFLGNLSAGSTVTLSYLADIDSSVDPGLYKDMAWAYGCSEATDCSLSSDDKLLAVSEDAGTLDPGVVADNFVGTKIQLSSPAYNSQSVNLVRQEEGQVLGATTELPATGSATFWLIFGLLSTIIGSLMVFRPKIAVLIILVLVAFMPASTWAVNSENIYVRLETPATPTNLSQFKLDYVALDLQGRQLNIVCYKINPDTSLTTVGSPQLLKAGGNSGQCDLSASPLTESGKDYSFYVLATVDSEEFKSDTVTVRYDTNTPGTPGDYSKEHPDACKYIINFRAANDNRTVKIQIYRSDKTEFTADDGTKVGEVGIQPDQSGSYTDVVGDCYKPYYYVIRAFDDAGNGSSLTGDSVTAVAGSTTVTTSTTIAPPVIVSAGNITTELEPTPSATLDTTTSPIPTPEGSVLGNRAKQAVNNTLQLVNNNKRIAFLLFLAGVALISYAYTRRRNQ